MRRLVLLLASLLASGCTIHHSRQALAQDIAAAPPKASRFVSEDDSGLLLFGLVSLTEPDHYAVLLERVRRKHKCARLSHGQLDFFTEHWLLVGFPVVRLTLVCEPEASATVAGTP